MFSRSLCKKAYQVAPYIVLLVFAIIILMWLGLIGFMFWQKEFGEAFLGLFGPPLLLAAIIGAGQNIEP